MARLTQVYNSGDNVNIGRRHLPLVAGDKLMMLMDLNSKGLVIDCPQIRGRELEEFTRKFNLLTEDERRKSLEIDSTEFISVLNQCVQCVGCRRRVERLFYQLTLSGHPTLDPLVLRESCTLSITEEKLKTPQALGTLLYRHHEVLNNLVDNKLRNKTRCVLHSLDAFRAKPFSETWREVWSAMKNNCRDELTVIETNELHEVLDNYLKKHKFCTGCRTKIEKAYKILVGEILTKEKGFVSVLYANIRKCVENQHIHVSTNKIDFLDSLIKRAEPEVNGSYSKLRERHAKTLEIAQEEVLTCVGMIMYERLRRIYVSLREEERACQVLAAVGVHALCRSFDTFVENKQGISNLELLYQEISRAEKAKELKREQKKLKKKKKKSEKKNMLRACEKLSLQHYNGEEEVLLDEAVDVCDGEGLADADDEQEEHDTSNISCQDSALCKHVTATVSDSDYGQDLDDDDDDDDADDDDDDDENLSHHIVAMMPVKQSKKSKKLKQQSPNTTTTTTTKKKKKQRVINVSAYSTAGKKADSNKTVQVMLQQESIVCADLNIRRNSCSSNNALNLALVNVGKCGECLEPTPNCPCEHDVRDSGYGSEPTSHANSPISSVISSPEGSEVSCSDGLCNHEPLDDEQGPSLSHCEHDGTASDWLYYHQQRPAFSYSLLQMLDDFDEDYYKDDENCYIPQEVVLKYQYQREKVQMQRQQLRAKLRERFQRMCAQHGVVITSSCH